MLGSSPTTPCEALQHTNSLILVMLIKYHHKVTITCNYKTHYDAFFVTRFILILIG